MDKKLIFSIKKHPVFNQNKGKSMLLYAHLQNFLNFYARFN